MSDDYISREVAIEAIKKHKEEMAKTGGVSNTGKAFYSIGQNHAIDVLRIVPTADVKPVVKGEWLTEYEPDGKPYCLHCSVCDDDFSIIGITTASNFCPNCGADMRKEENE